MSRWYRAYEGTVTDPKLAEAAMASGCSRSVAAAAWHLILENAATVNDGGRTDIPPRRIAAALCEPLATIETLHSSFVAIGLFNGSHVAAWKRRQYESDNSTARSQKHRAKKTAETLPPADDATLHKRCATPPKTETETEVPLSSDNGHEMPKLSAADMTKAIFDSGVGMIVGAGRSERDARSIIGRWRKQYTDSQVLAVMSRCPSNVSDPVEWNTKALQTEQGKANGTNNRTSGGQRPRSSLARAAGEGLANLGN